jgi:peptidoglycan/xylan/chitin deacetylase (PgdA/CDA1 family)
MYHYVRPSDDAQPFQRYLHVDDFERQLDHLALTHGIASRTDFERALADGDPCDGVVLTFDDALVDHVSVVLPILRRRGLWGIFYVPTLPYRTGRILDVHLIHLLLGRYGGAAMLAAMRELVTPDMLVHSHVEEFHTLTYQRPDDDAATDQFKRTLNYLVAEERRSEVVLLLTDRFDIDPTAVDDVYCSIDGLRSLVDAGMSIGSHGDAHVVMRNLSHERQLDDIEVSLRTLQDLVGVRCDSFCYPFGGHHTFDRTTEELLGRCGVRSAFNVESRDIDESDLRSRPLALPRYDCNEFPYGSASKGSTPPTGPGETPTRR